MSDQLAICWGELHGNNKVIFDQTKRERVIIIQRVHLLPILAHYGQVAETRDMFTLLLVST